MCTFYVSLYSLSVHAHLSIYACVARNDGILLVMIVARECAHPSVVNQLPEIIKHNKFNIDTAEKDGCVSSFLFVDSYSCCSTKNAR